MTNFDDMFWCPNAAIETISRLMDMMASCDRHYGRTGRIKDCDTCWAWWFCGGQREKAKRWLNSDMTRWEIDD